ncbi:hypothetical protein [Chryseobacterium gleum]|uniref:hypothetical protein n=1 Tax=Chryseobacterium gleum TaxID=250 RepID=UPI0031D17ADD
MKEFLQTILKSTEDRIKNPFIGTFITSWIIFNWKPILFIIFSDKGVEDKIDFIKDNYNDIWCYLWLPLISAVFYIAILPYISFVFEYVTKFSHGLRNKVNLEARNATLELQIGVAQNEIKLEEEKTTFRERNNHNLMVESLQTQNKILSETLEESNKINLESITDLQRQSENTIKDLRNIIDNNKIELASTIEKLNNETEKALELNARLEAIGIRNDKNFNEASQLRHQLNIQKFINHRLKNPIEKVINVGESNILEYFNAENDIVYFSINDGRKLSHAAVYSFLNGKSHTEFSDVDNVGRYKERLLRSLSDDQKAEIMDK